MDATARTIAEDWTSSLGTTADIGYGKSHIQLNSHECVRTASCALQVVPIRMTRADSTHDALEPLTVTASERALPLAPLPPHHHSERSRKAQHLNLRLQHRPRSVS